MRTFVRSLLLLLATSAAAQTVTLEEALDAARSSNRNLQQARLEVAKANEGISIVRSRQYPKVTLTAVGNQPLNRLNFDFEKGVFGTYPGVGPIPGEDTHVEIARSFNVLGLTRVEQPLSRLYDIRLGTRMARLEANVQSERARNAELAISTEVRRLYNAIAQSQSGANALDQSVKLLEELQRVVTRYVEQEVALRADLLEVNARLAGARQQRDVVTRGIASQKEQLNLLMGRALDAPLELAPTPPAVAADDYDISNRPDLRESELRAQQAELDLRLERSSYRPDVALLGTWITPTNTDILPTNITAVAIVANWTPFRWGASRAAVAQKSHTLEQAQSQARELRERATLELRTQQRNVENAKQLVDVRAAEQQVAAERFRVATEKYKQNAVLLREVLERENALASANHSINEATLALSSAVAELERAAGDVR